MGKFVVEKFPAHRQKLTFHESLSETVKNTKEINNICLHCNKKDSREICLEIRRHHFTCKVLVLLPHCGNDHPTVLSKATKLLTADTHSYLVRNLTLDIIASHTFSQCFTTKGEVMGFSHGQHLDTDDTASLNSTGRLSLLISRDTYHSLGLLAKPALNILRKPQHRYVVHINTLNRGFYPGQSGYNRTIERLHTLKFDFWITWRPYSSVCPSSIAKHFVDLGFQVEQVEPKVTDSFVMEDASVPLLNWLENSEVEQEMEVDDVESSSTVCDLPKDPHTNIALLKQQRKRARKQQTIDDTIRCKASQFLEAIGSLLLNIKPSVEDGDVCSRVDAFHCRALFSSSDLLDTVLTLREWLCSPDGAAAPWCCISLYSHPEVPFEVADGGCGTVGCKDLHCCCGLVEKDQHFVCGGMLLIVITRAKFIWFRHGSAGVRHRYYAKTSNNL